MAVEFLDAPDITEANDIPEAPEMSNVDLAKNLARAIGQGLTFGFADEAEGYARSILGDERPCPIALARLNAKSVLDISGA